MRTGFLVDHVQRTMINNIARAAPRSMFPARVAANLIDSGTRHTVNMFNIGNSIIRFGRSHARPLLACAVFAICFKEDRRGRILLPVVLGCAGWAIDLRAVPGAMLGPQILYG